MEREKGKASELGCWTENDLAVAYFYGIMITCDETGEWALEIVSKQF